MNRDSRTAAAPRKGALQRHIRAAYREAILDAAEAVFGVGYHAAKMSEIAREAGVSVGTVYNHFPSKEAVFDAIVERSHSEFFGELELVIANQPDPLQRLRAIVATSLAFIERRGELFAIYLERSGERLDAPRRLSPEEQAHHDRWLSVVCDALRAAQQVGRVRALDPELLASVLAGTLTGVLQLWIQRGRPPHLEDEAPVILDLFLDGAGS